MKKELITLFTEIKKGNHWGDEDSVSGTGSNYLQTDTIRKAIPELLKKYDIKFMIDAPCGDFFWMKEISLELETILSKYEGHDIVEELVSLNNSIYKTEKISFSLSDITVDSLPKADLIFTRDCLVHLSFANIYKVIRQYKKSKSKYLLTTTFSERTFNKDIQNGDWRTLNLQRAPFFFPKPILLINENCTEDNGNYKDKCLGLWEIKSLPRFSLLSIFVNNLLNRWR